MWCTLAATVNSLPASNVCRKVSWLSQIRTLTHSSVGRETWKFKSITCYIYITIILRLPVSLLGRVCVESHFRSGLMTLEYSNKVWMSSQCVKLTYAHHVRCCAGSLPMGLVILDIWRPLLSKFYESLAGVLFLDSCIMNHHNLLLTEILQVV